MIVTPYLIIIVYFAQCRLYISGYNLFLYEQQFHRPLLVTVASSLTASEPDSHADSHFSSPAPPTSLGAVDYTYFKHISYKSQCL